MAIYTAYLPPDGSQDGARFVSDRHSLIALVVPGFYLLFNRLWFAFGLYLLAGLAIGLVAWLAGDLPAALLSILPGLFLFLTANDLVAARLERQGWTPGATISADSRDEAEILFFTRIAAPSGVAPTRAALPAIIRQPAQPLGIFPE